MKKVLSTLVVISLLVGLLAGCGTGVPDSNQGNVSDSDGDYGDYGNQEEDLDPVYIEAPYEAADEDALKTEVLEPVFYENADGPTIGVTLVGVIQIGDKYFKDSDNDQELDVFEDWRLSAEERAEDAVSQASLKLKSNLVFNVMSTNPAARSMEDAMVDGKVDFVAVIGDPDPDAGGWGAPMGYKAVLEGGRRSGVFRGGNMEAEAVAYFNNALNQTAEYAAVNDGEIMLPFTLFSNPIGTGYPGSLGMTAAVMGDVEAGGDYSLISDYAVNDGKLWSAKGLDAMYGPQIDLLTDPRWNRNNTTYGEDEEVVSAIIVELIKGYQNGTEGLDKDSIALTVKHFPGDGAAYNGFESHNTIGMYRTYPTEGSLENYQLVPFQAAFDANAGGVMPGYSMPSTPDGAKSVSQSYRGVVVDGEEIGNGYNYEMLQTLLREAMGFKGFVNGDSGIIDGSHYGAEHLTIEQRVARVIEAGTDIISGENNPKAVVASLESDDLSQEALDRACYIRIVAMMKQERFDNSYVDTDNAKKVEEEVFAATADAKLEANQKSFVLLKNSGGALPLTDADKKVYVKVLTGPKSGYFGRDADKFDPEEDFEAPYREMFTEAGYTVVDDYNEADVAFLYADPGLNNCQHVGVIDLVEGLEVDEYNFPDAPVKTGNKYIEDTAIGIGEVPAIAQAVKANGGKVIGMVNFGTPWIMTNLEPYCDGLMGDFGGSDEAMLDVLDGTVSPSGVLPMTLPASTGVVAVEEVTENGVTYDKCASPNDIPGYDKDKYMDAAVLAQSPSGSYAYKDADGNIYEAWFGLSY